MTDILDISDSYRTGVIMSDATSSKRYILAWGVVGVFFGVGAAAYAEIKILSWSTLIGSICFGFLTAVVMIFLERFNQKQRGIK